MVFGLFKHKKDKPKAADSSKSIGIFERLKNGLSKTRKILTTDIDQLFAGDRKIDDELLEELEELLITSDIGVQTSMELIQRISKKSSDISNADQLKESLKKEIVSLFGAQTPAHENIKSKPHVVMVIGVNGTGKTTTIGKLAAKYTSAGKKVLIAASDTFRAAATEQLTIWADRAGAEIVKHKDNADPAAVAYDSIEAALARDIDIVLVDTAGRLHTKVNLMEELKKIKRTISKKMPDAPHEILLVLDATTGQNALSQATLFNDAIGVTGIALTKLDGTAKGGIVISICNSLEIQLKYIGIGEQINDLQDFDPVQFANALF
ncbi:MAG: signal recognition particle-docking protein FtsY [Deltaproteobacteria bacterium]|nr:signal recognition particle-docking protein FtsY [Deltaproteobacteria bacterium]MBW2662159.1 signal recognition particle-docking protein FtsY [Deltaproteobacteria bacterium]